jgi:PAS domain-containing protein
LVLDEALRVTPANPVSYKTFQVSPEETRGRLIYDLGNRQWDVTKLRELFQEITTRNARIDGFEVHHKFQHLGLRHMILNARRIEQQGGRQKILLSIEDGTRTESKRETKEKPKRNQRETKEKPKRNQRETKDR